MTAPIDSLRLLVIRLSALGDVVHTLPAVALVKKFVPDAHITWIVEPAFADILRDNPLVDELILFEKKSIARELRNPLWWLAPNSRLNQLVRQLRSRKFNAAIDFQGLFKSGILAFLSAAPLRIGFRQSREFSSRFYNHTLDVGDYFSFDTHVVDHNVALAEFLLRIAGGTNAESGTTRFFPLPDPGDASKKRMHQALNQTFIADVESSLVAQQSPARREGEDDSQADAENIPVSSAAPDGVKPHAASEPRVVVLIPGTTWITKIWPEDKWVRLTKRLLNELHNVRIVLIGGPAETEMNQYIYDRVRPDASEFERQSNMLVNLTGQTSLLDLIALFKMADLVIGADTGPLHIAAAVDHPGVIGIYGSTPWKRNGPYGSTSSVVALELECQPCFEKICPLSTIACLKDLDADLVFSKVEKALAE